MESYERHFELQQKQQNILHYAALYKSYAKNNKVKKIKTS